MNARLLVTFDCPKKCEGCCNKHWKGTPAKPIEHYNYNEFLITGGEPMLFPERVNQLICDIRRENEEATVYLYTATYNPLSLQYVLGKLNGVCITLHEQKDLPAFEAMIPYITANPEKSYRLNVFGEVDIRHVRMPDVANFRLKHMEWITDCPLPDNEEFVRLPEVWTKGINYPWQP
jgi:hypothetical protein